METIRHLNVPSIRRLQVHHVNQSLRPKHTKMAPNPSPSCTTYAHHLFISQEMWHEDATYGSVYLCTQIVISSCFLWTKIPNSAKQASVKQIRWVLLVNQGMTTMNMNSEQLTEESDPNVSFMFHNLILFNFFLSFSFSQYSTQFHHHQQNTVHPIPK